MIVMIVEKNTGKTLRDEECRYFNLCSREDGTVYAMLYYKDAARGCEPVDIDLNKEWINILGGEK